MNNKKEIRVILADDHAAVRRGIRRMLEKSPNIVVIGETSTGAGAIRLVQELKPDVLLLDMEMPDISGHHVTRLLRMNDFRVAILVLSACSDPHFIAETLQMGADGYLHKSEAPSKIRETIHHIFEMHAGVSVKKWVFNQLPG